MKLVQIYQCLCDETRLRILHVLTHTPLCVCHFQSVLQEPQVKISKHLTYLKKHGLAEVHRHQNWRIYRLPAKQTYVLRSHLKCLQDCIQENRLFREDLKRLRTVTSEASVIMDAYCGMTKQKQKASCC